MKKINFHPSLLQILYFILFAILFALIIFHTRLVTAPISINEDLVISEEILESSLVLILFFLSIGIVLLFQRSIRTQAELIQKINYDKKTAEEKMNDSFRYIGEINIQIQEIKSIFNKINKYPETKNDFKKTLRFFSERILGMVNAEWVLFRIIDGDTQKTISEHFEARPSISCNCPQVSNKMIAEKQPIIPFTTVISNPENLNIITSCILPTSTITSDQRVFIQAIANEITMLFVILNSSYYKNGNKVFIENENSEESPKKLQ